MIELIQVHEPTERQLADYNNRMVTEYEKESKPAIPTVNANRLERLQEGKERTEKPSVIRRIIARVKNICK